MQNIKSRFTGIKTRTGVAVGSLVAAASVSAQEATLPAEVTAAFTSIEGNYDAMASVAWPVIATIVGGFILVKLFKKFANKAS